MNPPASANSPPLDAKSHLGSRQDDTYFAPRHQLRRILLTDWRFHGVDFIFAAGYTVFFSAGLGLSNRRAAGFLSPLPFIIVAIIMAYLTTRVVSGDRGETRILFAFSRPVDRMIIWDARLAALLTFSLFMDATAAALFLKSDGGHQIANGISTFWFALPTLAVSLVFWFIYARGFWDKLFQGLLPPFVFFFFIYVTSHTGVTPGPPRQPIGTTFDLFLTQNFIRSIILALYAAAIGLLLRHTRRQWRDAQIGALS